MDGHNSPRELGTEKISTLLMRYSLPAIIAMTASSLYNMVDSMFIGHIGGGIGKYALSGLTITFPLMNLSAAVGAMVGVGASTMLSVRLGQKDYSSADKIFGNCFVLKIITGILFMLICFAFLTPILQFFGASEVTLPYATEYMTIILAGNVITHMYFGQNALLRSIGKPVFSMVCTIVTVILNAILDPIFIFTLDMGIKGAAIATVLSQAVSMCIQLKIFSNPNEIVHFKRGIYGLKKRIVGDILSVGMAPFLMNCCSCIVVVFVNKGLVAYGGDLAVAAYGIVNRIGFIFAMIVMGLNQGMQPIAGYNYGAQLIDRLMKVYYYTMGLATIVCCIAFVVGEFFPEMCVRIFNEDQDLMDIALPAMRLYMCTFPIIGFQMVTTNFFQSIGKAKISIFLSLTRQLIFLVPGLIILPRIYQLFGIWYAIPLSDLLASIMTAIVFFVYRNKFHQI
ncbi:MAG: MATE family efflux transporter [Prevotellaceae bacterium]|nr:MATE family efflux transporter [Candidatus Colivivens equi]